MPWARDASWSFDGKTIRSSSPVKAVSGWKVSKALSTARPRSEMRIAALPAQIARKICHLWTVAFGGRALAATWLATMASDSGRRPKGVVEGCGAMFFASIGQRESAHRNGAETLDSDSRKWDSLSRQTKRRASGTETFRGPFSFARLLLVGV